MVDDPSSWPDRFPTEESQEAERRRLHKVIEAIVPWEASNDEAILNAARWEIARSVAWSFGEEPPARGDGQAILEYLQTKAPPVYDPFSGGGSIPLEAQRLGVRAYGSDLNPVAVLIGKALVEIPPKFAGRPPVNPDAREEAARGELRAWKGPQGLAEDVRYYGERMRKEAEERIGHLYPKATLPDGSKATVIAWLWARTVRSPDPAARGAMVPLVSSFMLSVKEGKKAWAEPVLDSSAADGWRFEVRSGPLTKAQEAKLKDGTVGRSGGGTCILSGASMPFAYIREQGQSSGLGIRLMAVIADGPKGRVYLTPTNEQVEAAELAQPDWAPDVELPPNPRDFKTPNYGLRTFASLFTHRQLTALSLLSELVPQIADLVGSDYDNVHGAGDDGASYANSIAVYLALLVSQLSNHSSTICGWNRVNGQMRSTFALQALPMSWDPAEVNIFSESSGSLYSLHERMVKGFSGLPRDAQGANGIRLRDATSDLDDLTPRTISTDPPYYDNIGYAELSDFFYLWLRKSLSFAYPDLFRRIVVPKAEEVISSPFRHGGEVEGEAFFADAMRRAIANMSRMSADVPIAIYYAFKQGGSAKTGEQRAGWSAFLQGLVEGGLIIEGTWPIRTERSARSSALETNALASSIVLVCRRRSAEAPISTRADFVRALKREMPAAIDAIRKAGVGPVDMQQSVIGPGMEVFSRHVRVLEDDDSPMTVKTALTLINRVWEEIDNELDQAFDAETQVALAWFATYGFDARASGELITLANAKNTSDRGLFASGVFKDLKGKAALTPREELPRDWSPATDRTLTVWECVQHTARVLNAPDGGGEAAAALVGQMGPKAEEARALAYRLFEIATNKGWAAEALVYNELAQEWTKLEDTAATLGEPGRPPAGSQAAFTFEGTA